MDAVCCSVLKCVCSVLQCVSVSFSVLQCVAVCCSVLQFVLQCVAVCYNVLQCVSVCRSVLQYVAVCLHVQWILSYSNIFLTEKNSGTWWRRLIGCVMFTGHFLQKSPVINGSFGDVAFTVDLS